MRWQRDVSQKHVRDLTCAEDAGFFGLGVHLFHPAAQGPPGEISQAQLDNAISGSSANPNNESTHDSPFADPDLEAPCQKLNEMILNGRR